MIAYTLEKTSGDFTVKEGICFSSCIFSCIGRCTPQKMSNIPSTISLPSSVQGRNQSSQTLFSVLVIEVNVPTEDVEIKNVKHLNKQIPKWDHLAFQFIFKIILFQHWKIFLELEIFNKRRKNSFIFKTAVTSEVSHNDDDMPSEGTVQ